MQGFFDTARVELEGEITAALKENIVYNRTKLPPFRVPQVARQICAGLCEYSQNLDRSAAAALGEKLAEQGLGLRGLVAANRALFKKVLTGNAAAEPLLLAQAHDFTLALLEGAASSEAQLLTRQRDEIQATLERTIREREDELRRMIQDRSTPLTPVFDKILVLPLVAAIDHERALLITERILQEVVARKARVVIIDITGVPRADAQTAAALSHAAQAIKLLGANPILVGIHPEIAKQLLAFHVNLDGITAYANLQSGVEYALRSMGLSVQPHREQSPNKRRS